MFDDAPVSLLFAQLLQIACAFHRYNPKPASPECLDFGLFNPFSAGRLPINKT
jgi:hypothetical protein